MSGVIKYDKITRYDDETGGSGGSGGGSISEGGNNSGQTLTPHKQPPPQPKRTSSHQRNNSGSVHSECASESDSECGSESESDVEFDYSSFSSPRLSVLMPLFPTRPRSPDPNNSYKHQKFINELNNDNISTTREPTPVSFPFTSYSPPATIFTPVLSSDISIDGQNFLIDTSDQLYTPYDTTPSPEQPSTTTLYSCSELLPSLKSTCEIEPPSITISFIPTENTPQSSEDTAPTPQLPIQSPLHDTTEHHITTEGYNEECADSPLHEISRSSSDQDQDQTSLPKVSALQKLRNGLHIEKLDPFVQKQMKKLQRKSSVVIHESMAPVLPSSPPISPREQTPPVDYDNKVKVTNLFRPHSLKKKKSVTHIEMPTQLQNAHTTRPTSTSSPSPPVMPRLHKPSPSSLPQNPAKAFLSRQRKSAHEDLEKEKATNATKENKITEESPSHQFIQKQPQQKIQEIKNRLLQQQQVPQQQEVKSKNGPGAFFRRIAHPGRLSKYLMLNYHYYPFEMCTY